MTNSKTLHRALIITLLLLASLCVPSRAAENAEIPHLHKQGSATQLIVNGKPFLILGGELHNSSASSLEYMQPIWPRLVSMNLNTALAVVSWELIEPEQGKFDFTLVDGLIRSAREHNLRLVFLWFGSWKNGVSTYVPGWVKKDVRRFPQVQRKNGDKVEVLTPLCEASCQADAKAFAALMRHIASIDRAQQTVIMVQIENEVGTLGDSRDRSPLAEEAFAQSVPEKLMTYFQDHKATLIPEFKAYWESTGFKPSGTWSEVFGDGADEAFMAWHMATYIGKVAAAGKAEYAIPMYANAWLVQHEKQPAGQYPSGGPVSKVMDIWRAAAPSIDFIAPDIYLPDFKAVCASYTRNGNPLFIPEASRGPESAANVFYAIGQHDAIGFCPFGIDSLPTDHLVAASYRLLAELTPVILQHQGSGRIAAVLQGQDERQMITLGGYGLEIGFHTRGKAGAGYGIIINTAPDEYLIAGTGFGIHFGPRSAGPRYARILSIDEGHFRDGNWIPGRRMNGDENAGGWRLQLPIGALSIQRIKLYRHD